MCIFCFPTFAIFQIHINLIIINIILLEEYIVYINITHDAPHHVKEIDPMVFFLIRLVGVGVQLGPLGTVATD
jgi:hypothetical protein